MTETPDTLTLLGLPESVYTRIARLAFIEKGVSCSLRPVDIFSDQGVPTEYWRHHPFGRIPTLLHGEFELYETGAITRYVDAAFDGPSLQPDTPHAAARMNQIISLLDAYAYRAMVWDLFVERIVIPQESEGSSDEELVAAALPDVESCLEALAGWLADRQYLVGDSLSLADLHATPMLAYLVLTPEGGELIGRHPRLRAWLARMQERPAWQDTRSVYG